MTIIPIWQTDRSLPPGRRRVGGAFTREAAIAKVRKIARSLGPTRGLLVRRGNLLGVDAVGGFVYVEDAP